MKAHSKIVLFTALALTSISCSKRDHVSATRVTVHDVERGGEWLSWTPEQRNKYVYGFIDGYMKGTIDACNATDGLFEVREPHRLGGEHRPTQVPSGRCLAHIDRDYSNAKLTNSGTDTSNYAAVITEFYAKHPEYGQIPFPNLILLLTDKKHKSAEQMYEMAIKSEIRPPR